MIARTEYPVVPLSYLADVRPSGVDKHTHADEVPVRLCNYMDIYYRERITNDIDFMEASATPAEMDRFALAPGDVVMTKDSETADDIGIPALVIEGLDSVLLGYHNTLVRPTAKLEPRFLFWFLSSRVAAAYWETKARGVTRVGLRTEDVAALPVPVPPLATQRRIADMLDAETARIDALIAKNDTASRLADVKLREEIVAATTRGLSPSGLRDTGSTWAPQVNSSWGWAPYQYFAELGSGHTPSRSREDLWVDCTVPWITTADVKRLRGHRREFLDETEHHVSERGLAQSAARQLPARTVVLSRTASVGFSAIMARPMATSQDFFTWTCDERKLLPEYLLYVLRGMKFRGHFDRLMYGSTHKTIYFPDLVQLRGPIPPVDEQKGIVDYIRNRATFIHQLIDRVQQMNGLLRLRRQALITAAVTGEIEP